MIRNLFIATALVAVSCVAATPVSAQLGQGNSANNLFSQYVTPAGPNAATAGMYPAPYDSPLMGAQSYYTYQPLMPHEMMYQHSRNYYNYYNTGGYYGAPNALNKTSVRWQSGSNFMGPLHFGGAGEKLKYHFQNKRYSINDGGGRARRGRHHGGLGCTDGNCGSGAEISGGCATGGCTANLNDGSIQR